MNWTCFTAPKSTLFQTSKNQTFLVPLPNFPVTLTGPVPAVKKCSIRVNSHNNIVLLVNQSGHPYQIVLGTFFVDRDDL